jgi:hypothetical protein
MSTAPETVLQRVRTVISTGDALALDPAGVRVLLAELLYDGHGVPDWHELAGCREHAVGQFFPEGGEDTAKVEAAKAVCAGCPVRAACLADVMAWERPSARFGVVGGLSAHERQLLHRATRRAAAEGGAAA